MEAITSPPMLKDSTTPNAFFNPLLISILGIVVTSTAIIAYHLLLVKFCVRRHASSTAVQSTAAPQLCPGVDEKFLLRIPIVAFTAVKRGTDQLEECVVCLGELDDEDMVRLLPNCNHAFHAACIDQWFAAHTNCPLCRSPILEQSDAEQSLDPNRSSDSDLGGSDESSAIDPGREPPLSPRERSCRLLRHCASLVVAPPTPMERTAPSLLKRSLSMDESFVVINLQRDNCSSDSSSPSSSSASIVTSGGSSSAPSMSHFDRVSSKWLRSFSRLRMGRGNNGSILPY